MRPETATRANIIDSVIDLILSETKRVALIHPSKRIIIFGAVSRGIVLHEALKILGKKTEYFIDSSTNKHNTLVCGIPVYEPMKIMYENIDDVFVIVAAAEPKQLIDMVKTFGLDPCVNVGYIFDSQSIGDGTARVEGMPLIDFFLGYNRMSDLPGFKCENKNENDATVVCVVVK